MFFLLSTGPTYSRGLQLEGPTIQPDVDASVESVDTIPPPPSLEVDPTYMFMDLETTGLCKI